MPKIKDLGIKVIPETMRPPEAGWGAGCGCTLVSACTDQTAITNQLCGDRTANFCHVVTYCGWTCFGCTRLFTCGFFSRCGVSFDTIAPGGQITHQQIAQLKESLQQQIAALDELAKSVGPRTAAEIDAREKQLNDELASLKSRRKELGRK